MNSAHTTSVVPTSKSKTLNHQTVPSKSGLPTSTTSAHKAGNSSTNPIASAALVIATSNLIDLGAFLGTNKVNPIAAMKRIPLYSLMVT